MKTIYANTVIEVPYNVDGRLVLQPEHMLVRGMLGAFGQIEVLSVEAGHLHIPAHALSTGELGKAREALFEELLVPSMVQA